MTARAKKTRRALTLVELMTAMLLSFIVIFAVAVTLADGQKTWQALYNKNYTGAMADGIYSTKAFEATIRKASAYYWRPTQDIDTVNGEWVRVYYYSDPTNPAIATPDRYARFKLGTGADVGKFQMEHGDFTASTYATSPTGTVTLASTVDTTAAAPCKFTSPASPSYISIEMVLHLKDKPQASTGRPADIGRAPVIVSTSAVMNNP